MSVRAAQCCILFCSVMFLCQCTKAVNIDPQPQQEKQAASPFPMPAAAYLALAGKQPESARQSTLMMAAGRYLHDDQWQDALRILTQTSTVSLAQADEKNIMLAKIDAIRDQPRAAINRLSTVKEVASLPAWYQTQYYDTLAHSYENAGNAANAIAERIKADPLLADDASRRANQRNLWFSLSKLPMPELSSLSVEAKDGSDSQAWLQLALISRQSGEQSLLEKLEQWQQRYPEHPANRLLPQSLSAMKPYIHAAPQRMALLLPITGPLAGPGSAVRDGFMAAYNAGKAERDTNVSVYDTASSNVSDLYAQAIKDGAEYVVGPLTKNNAATVAALPHPVPTLLLNDVEGETGSNVWQFGLSPSNEARQVAIKAHKDGLSRALIIAPAGAWGEDVVAAFSAQWQKSGATVVEQLAYENNSDLNQSVRKLLHVSEREAQANQVKTIPGESVPAAKRRQDFDMIFLIAYPSRARQVMPLLRYYFAGDVPVYATSSVYAGNTNTLHDRDLDGLIFCDMPWVFTHQLANKNWPEQYNSYSRLYALGMDSYNLSTQMNQLMLFPATSLRDQGGLLYLNQVRQVARVPAWGKFKHGVAVPISGTV